VMGAEGKGGFWLCRPGGGGGGRRRGEREKHRGRGRGGGQSGMGRNGIRQRRVFIRHEVNELVWWFLDFLERIPEGHLEYPQLCD